MASVEASVWVIIGVVIGACTVSALYTCWLLRRYKREQAEMERRLREMRG